MTKKAYDEKNKEIATQKQDSISEIQYEQLIYDNLQLMLIQSPNYFFENNFIKDNLMFFQQMLAYNTDIFTKKTNEFLKNIFFPQYCQYLEDEKQILVCQNFIEKFFSNQETSQEHLIVLLIQFIKHSKDNRKFLLQIAQLYTSKLMEAIEENDINVLLANNSNLIQIVFEPLNIIILQLSFGMQQNDQQDLVLPLNIVQDLQRIWLIFYENMSEDEALSYSEFLSLPGNVCKFGLNLESIHKSEHLPILSTFLEKMVQIFLTLQSENEIHNKTSFLPLFQSITQIATMGEWLFGQYLKSFLEICLKFLQTLSQQNEYQTISQIYICISDLLLQCPSASADPEYISLMLEICQEGFQPTLNLFENEDGNEEQRQDFLHNLLESCMCIINGCENAGTGELVVFQNQIDQFSIKLLQFLTDLDSYQLQDENLRNVVLLAFDFANIFGDIGLKVFKSEIIQNYVGKVKKSHDPENINCLSIIEAGVYINEAAGKCSIDSQSDQQNNLVNLEDLIYNNLDTLQKNSSFFKQNLDRNIIYNLVGFVTVQQKQLQNTSKFISSKCGEFVYDFLPQIVKELDPQFLIEFSENLLQQFKHNENKNQFCIHIIEIIIENTDPKNIFMQHILKAIYEEIELKFQNTQIFQTLQNTEILSYCELVFGSVCSVFQAIKEGEFLTYFNINFFCKLVSQATLLLKKTLIIDYNAQKIVDLSETLVLIIGYMVKNVKLNQGTQQQNQIHLQIWKILTETIMQILNNLDTNFSQQRFTMLILTASELAVIGQQQYFGPEYMKIFFEVSIRFIQNSIQQNSIDSINMIYSYITDVILFCPNASSNPEFVNSLLKISEQCFEAVLIKCQGTVSGNSHQDEEINDFISDILNSCSSILNGCGQNQLFYSKMVKFSQKLLHFYNEFYKYELSSRIYREMILLAFDFANNCGGEGAQLLNSEITQKYIEKVKQSPNPENEQCIQMVDMLRKQLGFVNNPSISL